MKAGHPIDGEHARPSVARRAGEILLPLVPGALVVLFSFQAGGFFPGATALVAIGLVVALVLQITIPARPFAGLGAGWAVGAGLLALFAVWTLVSSAWSDAPARALVEYDRALLYLLAFVTAGALGRTPQRLRWLLRGLALGVVVVCVCALTTRLAPDVWEVETLLDPERLSYPLTYWNALGLLAALGCLFCVGLTTDAGEPAVSRVLAAAAVPLLCMTVVLTFSRGSIVAGVVGLGAIVVLARPALLLSGLVAAGPAAAFAVSAALGADLVTGADPTSAAAAAEGHELALKLALCTGAAVLLRSLALLVDPAFARVRLPAALRRGRVVAPAALAAVLVVVVAFFAVDGPRVIERQVDRFATADTVSEAGAERLTNLSNNGRIDPWRVALDAFDDDRLRGSGAGTWALEWSLRRPNALQVNDAHSLYLEVLAELGVLGLLLLAGALIVIVGGLALRARGVGRGPGGALCAATIAWAIHAAIDWDWEMPAVTMWVFVAGGMALSAPLPAPARRAGGRPSRGVGRIVAGLACLVMVLTPLSVLRSERALRDAQQAFGRGDCTTAIDRALASSSALESRPEPYFIVGVCDIRAGFGALAIRALDKAVARDPGNWEYRYGLALVRGAAGRDPRPAAGQALRRNPREALAISAVRRFATRRPEVWKRRALAARLPAG